MSLLVKELSPFTGFGDDPNWSIKFSLLLSRNGQLPQWRSPPRRTKLRIHNSNDTIRQRHGRDPWTVSWRLEFAHYHDWERLEALIDETSTLRYRASLTPNLDGEVVPIDRVPYLVLPNTTLDDLTDAVMEDDGTYEATATFQRTYVAPPPFDPPDLPPAPTPIPTPWGFGDWFFGDEAFGEGHPEEAVMMRVVSATITNPTGVPREGLPVWFSPLDGSDALVAMADASGTIRVELDTAVVYRVSVENAVTVDGITFPAGTVFVVQVPDGEGIATALESLVETIDASRTAILDAVADLTARVTALEGGA